jgi:hypothetical protein
MCFFCVWHLEVSSLVEHVQEKNKGNGIQSSSKQQHDVSSSKGGVSQKTGAEMVFLKDLDV